MKAQRKIAPQKATTGKATRKVLIIFCYYVIFAVVSLTAFTLASRNLVAFQQLGARYFLCERRGHNENNPCDRSFLDGRSMPALAALSKVLLAMFPIANLIFVIPTQKFQEVFRKVKSSLIYQSTS